MFLAPARRLAGDAITPSAVTCALLVASVAAGSAATVNASAAERPRQLRYRDLGDVGAVVGGSGVVADGHEWVAWQTGDLTLHLRDDRTGRTLQTSVPAQCTLADVARAIALLSCGNGSGEFAVPRLFGDAYPAPTTPPGIAARDILQGIGSYWLAGEDCDPPGRSFCAHRLLYINWRTGERRYPNAIRDPDSPSLAPRPPFSAARPRVSLSKAGLSVTVAGSTRRISGCRPVCRNLVVADNRVLYTQQSTLRIYDAGRRRAYVSRFPKSTSVVALPSTSRFVYALGRRSNGYRLLRVRLP